MTAKPARATRGAMLTVAQAAVRLGFDDPREVYHWINLGLLPAVQYPTRNGAPNGPMRIAEADVDEFIKAHRKAS